MATATTPPVTAKVTTSVDPIWQQALAQAQQSLGAEAAPVQAEQAASDQQYAGQEKDATGVAAALANILKGIGPAVSNTYSTAAQDQELAAKGFSSGMQDALQGNTDNLNAMLKQLAPNAPATIDSKAPQLADVAYGIGGYNPGTAFSKEGAAFSAAADMLPAQATAQGADNVKELQGKALLADQGFANKLAEIAGKLPGQALDNYSKLQSLALENKRFALAVKNQKFTQAMSIAKQKLAVSKANVQVQEFNARQALASAKFARQQFTQDRSYQLSLSRLGIAQKGLQLRIAQNAFKEANGGYSQKDLTKIRTQALGFAQQAFHGTTRTTSKGSYVSGKLSYGAAMTQMLKKGWPVQSTLSALNQVYGQPNADQEKEIAAALGPLAPASLQATIARNQQNLDVAGIAMTNPTSLLAIPKIKAIGQAAAARGLDPQAVLAVSQMEGLSGGIGDNGHAFGPFQLNNAGGVLTGMFPGATPEQLNEWAWSQDGINFALDRIAKVARGLTGEQAIRAIVSEFERPLKPGPEIAGAVARYGG